MHDYMIRAIIFYEFYRGSSTRQATKNINITLGEGTVSQSTVSRWYRRFASGDRSLEDKERSGRPVELEKDDLLRELQEHPDATTRELGQALGCSHRTVESRLHELGYRRVLARWIPHELDYSRLYTRVTICQSLFHHPQRKDFLAHLVTGDESMILYKNDTRVAYWLPRGEKPPVQPKVETHCRKVVLCCWWDARGMIYYELLNEGETVSSNLYADQLRKLSKAIKEKRRRMTEVHLLHDNARPHIASVTRQTLEDLGWATVPHPPYSPDLAPSDYHLFRALKNFLRRQRFPNFDTLQSAIDTFFESQPAEFWERGIQSLPERWRQVIDSSGEYIVD